MKLRRLFTYIIILIIGFGIAWFIFNRTHEEQRKAAEIFPAKIADIQPMVELCSVELIRELPFKARVGHRHIFARMLVNGKISFDIDSLELSMRNDTVVVILPPEKITLFESTEPDSYKVLDTWRDTFWSSGQLKASEENEIKREALEKAKYALYTSGDVRRARKEATNNLANLLFAMYNRPVMVIDRKPNGFPQLNNLHKTDNLLNNSKK